MEEDEIGLISFVVMVESPFFKPSKESCIYTQNSCGTKVYNKFLLLPGCISVNSWDARWLNYIRETRIVHTIHFVVCFSAVVVFLVLLVVVVIVVVVVVVVGFLCLFIIPLKSKYIADGLSKQASTHALPHARTHAHTHTHARTHARTHALTHARTHTRTHERNHTFTHTSN